MKRLAVGAAALAVACLLTGTTAAAPPPGASARCRDGTYSFSTHRRGTCSHHRGVAAWLSGGKRASLPLMAAVAVGQTVLLDPRSRVDHCVRGDEPDRRCSPGAISSGLTKAVLCSPRFRTGQIRNVPDALKRQVELAYGLPARRYGRTLEIDHIVSLELGGSNDIANLFPEPGDGAANYHVKDKLENKLHDLVCAGEMSLRAAQKAIARDWIALNRRVFG